MKPAAIQRISTFLACFTASCAGLKAQTLQDVLLSLSDRQRVLVQREQVRAQLYNVHANGSLQLPDDSPISWVGVGTDLSETNSQGIGIRVALINQAVAEFDRIAVSYANVSVAELEGGEAAGAIEFYRAGDFPPLPRATPENYQEVLRQLGLRIRTLRVLLWPSAFESFIFSGSGFAYEEIGVDEEDNPAKIVVEDGLTPFSWLPSTIGTSNIDAEESSGSIHIGESAVAAMTVSGTYSEDPTQDEEVPGSLRQQTVIVSTNYPKRAIVLSSAQGAQGTQIGGTIRILRRSRWHQLSVSGAPSRFDPSEGSFVIEGGASSGEIALVGSPPETGIGGSWVTTESGETEDGEWLKKRFVEAGYQLKGDSLLDPEDAGYSDAFDRAYEKNWTVGCRFISLFQPDFTRGVDAAAARPNLDSVNRMLAGNTADGALLLHPRPNLLFGIDLGPGLTGAGGGLLTAAWLPSASEDWWKESAGGASTYGLLVSVPPLRRFDLAYALRLAGSANDYHVVFDNDRDERGQTLPQLGWPYAHDEPGGPFYDPITLYHAWDSPRLKQVVGRDLVANVTYSDSHYGGYTITVYRRPDDAPDPTPGEIVATGDLPVVRTWTFSKPDIGANAHPASTDTEKLHVDGNAGEKIEISATHAQPLNGAGWDPSWDLYRYKDWGGVRSPAFWWASEGERKWILKLSHVEQEKWRKEIGIETTNLSTDPWSPNFVYATKVATFLDHDEQPVGELTSDTLDPFGDATPSDWSYAAGGKTFVGTPVRGGLTDPAFRYGNLPVSLEIEFDGTRADMEAAWNEHGMLESITEGAWKTEGESDGTAWKFTRKFNDQAIARDWFEFTGPAKIKNYSAPDGTPVQRDDPSVASTEVEIGTLSTGMPGLPHRVTRSDGTGTTFEWAIAADGSGSLVAGQGLLAGGSLSRGREVTREWNIRGFTTASSETLKHGGTIKTAGASVPPGQFTDWGMPTKWKDDFSVLATSWSFDGNRSRTASVTSPLGLNTGFSDFDVFDRAGGISANGITASRTFAGLSVETDYSGTDIQAGTESTSTRDALGRLTASNTTWNGVVNNLGLTHGADTLGVTRTLGPYGTHTSEIRQSDGSLEKAEGPTLPFDGIEGSGISVAGGLLVSKTEVADVPGTYLETHTDALGRVRKVITPSKSGAGSTTTQFTYTDPDSTLHRVITHEPSGRVYITESDPYAAGGAVTRSGIDVNDNGSLGATDRYTESVTKVEGGKVLTTLKITEDTGLREILGTEWTPSTGVTVTRLNDGEETITATPNYTAKTVTTTSTKGWTRTTGVNPLGLPNGNTLSGTGIPATELTPVWRADGSLASVDLEIGGETHSAAFNYNGTLSSLTAPGRGNILGVHSIAGGVETLTVDGTTVESRLDGTLREISGPDVTDRDEVLSSLDGSGYKFTVDPEEGGSTDTVLNTAGAATAKNYAAGLGEIYGYHDELLSSVTLARGNSLILDYSDDGSKDLVSAVWPAVTSGDGPTAFAIPAVSHGFGYDRAGRVDEIGDAAGVRSLGYDKGRLVSSVYDSGPLKGYEIIGHRDAAGRDTGFTLKRDGAVIHSAASVPNDVSDQILALASGDLKVIPQRDAAGRITGFEWGNATGTFVPAVTQAWQRGAGGRIEEANSDVAGAPSFNYAPDSSSFDTRGRRLKCATAGGTWTYQYTNGRLTNATHTSLGSFGYTFDAVGRRLDKDPVGTDLNSTDLLNRTRAWTHDQSKTVKVTAHPDARVWVNGVEVPGFSGQHSYAITPPGANGGWVAWEALAVLEGQGEGAGSPPANPLASPDAKALKKGAVWVPPVNESFTFDDAGNRESSAQWEYGWDAKNQLVRARTKSHDSAAQGWDLTFSYDAEGRRFKKHVIEYRDGARVGEKNITFLWDGWDLIYERHQLPSGLTTLERKYLWGPDIADGAAGAAGGAGGLLLIRETKGSTITDLYPLYDGTGHVVALTNNSGALLASYAYGPFGELIHATGPAAHTNPWRYATKYFDHETGLTYFGHRYHDPVTGQWLSREPLGESESVNLYDYCHSDPINKVDILGLAEVAINDASDNWASRKFRELVFGMFPGMGAMMSEGNPQSQAFYIRSAQFQNSVSIPILRSPGQAIQATGNAISEGATEWGGNRIAGGSPITGYGGGVTVGIAGQLVSGVGGMLDPIGMIDAGQDYFIVQANDVWRNSGGGWNGVQAVARHDLTAWNVEKAYNGFASGDYESGWEGVGATASTALIFLAPQMQATRLPNGAGPMVRTSPAAMTWWERGMYLRVPAELYSGVPRLEFRWGAYLRGLIGDPPAGMINPHAHHILYKRGHGRDQQRLVAEGQSILRRAGIDPIYGPENLTWAPMRVVEQHGPGPLSSLVADLRRLEATGGVYDDFVKLLKNYGKVAQARR